VFPTAARDVSLPDDFDSPTPASGSGSASTTAVLTGAALVAGVALNASSGVLVATVPTTLSIGLVVGSSLGARADGLPERTGRSRRLTAAWFVPAVAFAGSARGSLSAIDTDRARTRERSGDSRRAVRAAVIATMARTRYVAAITPDDPVAAWQWRSPNRVLCLYAFAICYFALGFVTREISFFTVQWFLLGLLFLVQGTRGQRAARSAGRGSGRVTDGPRTPHPRGGTGRRGADRNAVSSLTDIGSVSLTDENLVLERSWIDLRCDRSAIDDPEGVRAAIEQRRNRAGLDGA